MTVNKKIGALVLAGGKGTRMHSETPKVLQLILDKPMLYYVYKSLKPLFNNKIWTIVGHEAESVKEFFPEEREKAVLQAEQLGTGHALSTAWPQIKEAGLDFLMVINGDTPQVSTASLKDFQRACLEGAGSDLGFMTLELEDPQSFGRVLRKENSIRAIIEAKDYSIEKYGPEPKEVNAGIYWLKVSAIDELLPKLDNQNKSGEFYITDLIALAVEKDLKVLGVPCGTDSSLMGVNTPYELVLGEDSIRKAIVQDWQKQGVFIRQAETVRIGPEVKIAPGVNITGPCEIYGQSHISSEVQIDSHCKIVNSNIEKGAKIHSFSFIADSTVGPLASVGPYARLRPGSYLSEKVHIGNFVEVKNSKLMPGSKASHLSYIGDTEVGENSNIGAGTITCNYDGQKKHKTLIGKKVFIGSNTALVAPLEIGDKALIGAGSVITKNVPENNMAIARGKQKNMPKRNFD